MLKTSKLRVGNSVYLRREFSHGGPDILGVRIVSFDPLPLPGSTVAVLLSDGVMVLCGMNELHATYHDAKEANPAY